MSLFDNLDKHCPVSVGVKALLKLNLFSIYFLRCSVDRDAISAMPLIMAAFTRLNFFLVVTFICD